MTAPTRRRARVDFYRPPGYREILPRLVQAIFYPNDEWVIVGWMFTPLALVLALWVMWLVPLFWLVPTAGYKILFDELEDHDSEVSWSGEVRTGQVALREQCGDADKTYVHITNRPA